MTCRVEELQADLHLGLKMDLVVYDCKLAYTFERVILANRKTAIKV